MTDPPSKQSASIPQYGLGELPALRRAHVRRWLCGIFNPAPASGSGTHHVGGIYEVAPHTWAGHVSHLEFAQATLAIRTDGYVVGRFASNSGHDPGLAFLNMASKELEVPSIDKRQIKNTIAWTVGCYANNGERITSNKWFGIAGPLTLLVYRARHPEFLLP